MVKLVKFGLVEDIVFFEGDDGFFVGVVEIEFECVIFGGRMCCGFDKSKEIVFNECNLCVGYVVVFGY